MNAPGTIALDPVAAILMEAGTPGIIARESGDGNGFLLQRFDSMGRQLELRRMPATSCMNVVEAMEQLSAEGRVLVFDATLLAELGSFAWELNGRSRIKEIVMMSRQPDSGELYPGLALSMENGTQKVTRPLNGSQLTFTGRHWILCSLDE